MGGDNHALRTYGAAMERGQPFIRLRLDVDQPIELGEFVGAFTALASEYDRFMRADRPGYSPDATLFVKEVRAGSIEADLVAWGAAAASVVGLPAAYNVLDEFVERLGARLRIYSTPGGRVEGATKGELSDFLNQTAAIASTPNSALEVAAMEWENGEEKVRVAFKFNTGDAREIQQRIEEHKREIDHQSRSDHSRVLMRFTRSDVGDAQLGKRSGEKVIIEAISPKPRPLIYASKLAEDQIKDEIKDPGDNVYFKGFIVDVNVEMRGGKPVAYSVTSLHQIIELPTDDED